MTSAGHGRGMNNENTGLQPENDATSVGWDDDAKTWEEAVGAGWKRTADRWDPETLTLRPLPNIPPDSTGHNR